MLCTGELTECYSQLYSKNKQVHRKRDRICRYWKYAEGCWEGNWNNLVKGYKLSEHHPAGSGGRPRRPGPPGLCPRNPDLEGAPGPKHPLHARHRPTRATSPKHRGVPGQPGSRHPPASRPVSRRVLPSTALPETRAPAGDRSERSRRARACC